MRLQRPLELEPGRSDHRAQPRIELPTGRLTRQQHALGGKGTDRNRVRAGVPVRRRQRRQQRLVSQRVDAHTMAPRRPRHLQRRRSGKLMGRDPPDQLLRDALLQPEANARTLRRGASTTRSTSKRLNGP